MKVIKERIFEVVIEQANNVLDTIDTDQNIHFNEETRIFGKESLFDSLGLVNLIVAVETAIEDEFDVSIVIANEKAMSQKHSPFRTVGTLANYIALLLKEKTNE